MIDFRSGRVFVPRQAQTVLLLLTYLGFGSLAFDQPSYSASASEISVLFPPRPDFGTVGLTTAVKAGIFEHAGLKVDLRQTASEDEIIDKVASDPSAIGLISAISFLKARARGVAIVAFAAGYLETTTVFYVAEDSKIRTPSDFVGKHVGYGSGEEEQLTYETMMLRLRLPRFRVNEIRTVGGSALAGDSLDVWPGTIGRASVELREKKVRFRTIKPSDFGIHILGTVFCTGQGEIHRSRDKLASFLRGVIDGWDLVYANVQNRTLVSGVFDTSFNDETINFIMEEQRPYLRPFGLRVGEFDRRQWKVTQDALVDAQLLRRPLDISQFADFNIIRDAYRKVSPLTRNNVQ